jgi:hypothetical protein
MFICLNKKTGSFNPALFVYLHKIFYSHNAFVISNALL